MDDRKVKIYALINTLDDTVFYIGATVSPLKWRLDCHKDTTIRSTKNRFVRNIKEQGGTIEILGLDETEKHNVRFMEEFYMDLFRSYGYTLIQGRKSGYW